MGWKTFSTVALLPAIFTYATDSGSLNEFARRVLETCYSQFTNFPNPNPRVCRLFPRSVGDMREAFGLRKRNLEIVHRYFLGNGYPPDLEEGCDLAPFVAPYFNVSCVLTKIVSVLKKIGVETDVYHFDRERNMLRPDYQKCVPLPVHQGITASHMEEICRTVGAVARMQVTGQSSVPRFAT